MCISHSASVLLSLLGSICVPLVCPQIVNGLAIPGEISELAPHCFRMLVNMPPQLVLHNKHPFNACLKFVDYGANDVDVEESIFVLI